MTIEKMKNFISLSELFLFLFFQYSELKEPF